MPYTQITLANFATELSISLGDPTKTFWTDVELRGYLIESLQTWNTLATYWRGRLQFQTAPNQQLYNLTSAISPSLTPILPLPAHIGGIVNSIQYALMEPVTDFSGGYVPIFPTTAMYEDNEINAAVLQAVAQFNFDVNGVLVIEPDIPLPFAPSNQIDLNENLCDIRHAQVQLYPDGVTPGVIIPLKRQDEFELLAYGTPFIAVDPTDQPNSYSFLLSNGQPSIRIYPPSAQLGQLQLVSARSTTLPPMDWQWAVKWLSLYFLLTQDGQCRDFFRATYCKKRYMDAMLAAKLYPSVLQASINNLPFTAPTTPWDKDAYEAGWQNLPTAQPNDVILYGWNVIGLSPKPNAGPYAVSLDMVTNTPLTDPIQLAQEHKQTILDYAKHLAAFKMGGTEFESTNAHWEKMLDMAMEYNAKLRIEAKNFPTLRDRAKKDAQQMYPQRKDANDSLGVTGG